MGYFKNVESYDDLKNQYKKLLKANHPDNGGNDEVMKEINVEYDALFAIWKDKAARGNTLNEEEKEETAQSTRRQFYTDFGWEGSNHNWDRSLKDVAKIVRAYVKEKYPTYKFSVRTSYASMCQELHVELKESPIEVYKTVDELTDEDKYDFVRKANRNDYWSLSCWNDEEFKEEYNRITSEHGSFYKIMNEATKSVIEDVDNFVKSYNYEDCDGMIDYFHVDFYYFGCAENNGMNIKVVPRTPRIKNNDAGLTRNGAAPAPGQDAQKQPEQLDAENSCETSREAETVAADSFQEEKSGYTYTITQGQDTRDGSDLWVVRIEESLDKQSYIRENMKMHDMGAYYSRFLHGFIFRYNPTDALAARNAQQHEQPSGAIQNSERHRGR